MRNRKDDFIKQKRIMQILIGILAIMCLVFYGEKFALAQQTETTINDNNIIITNQQTEIDNLKKENQKRYAVPIIITLILLLYFVVYFGVLIAILPKDWKYVLFIFPVALAVIGLLIYVCIDRIKEIMSGEEDDLGKY